MTPDATSENRWKECRKCLAPCFVHYLQKVGLARPWHRSHPPQRPSPRNKGLSLTRAVLLRESRRISRCPVILPPAPKPNHPGSAPRRGMTFLLARRCKGRYRGAPRAAVGGMAKNGVARTYEGRRISTPKGTTSERSRRGPLVSRSGLRGSHSASAPHCSSSSFFPGSSRGTC